MRNLDCVLPAQEFGAAMMAQVTSSWTSRMATAASIEARLWSDDEARFAHAHEHDLAYRYLPLVEKGGSKTKKVTLQGIKPRRAQVKMALGQYWHRHKVSRGQG